MNKRYGMSAMGYAIATVILIGVVMIFSTPMIVDSYNTSNTKKKNNIPPAVSHTPVNPPPVHNYTRDNNSNNQDYINITQEIRNVEERLSMRISDIEQKQAASNQPNASETAVSDKYVCSIEGLLAENGDVIPLNDSRAESISAKKFVFLCEYRK